MPIDPKHQKIQSHLPIIHQKLSEIYVNYKNYNRFRMQCNLIDYKKVIKEEDATVWFAMRLLTELPNKESCNLIGSKCILMFEKRY